MTQEIAKYFKTLSVKQAASIKGVSKQTLYNNKLKFDWEGPRIVRNAKFNKWEPVVSHKNKKYIDTLDNIVG